MFNFNLKLVLDPALDWVFLFYFFTLKKINFNYFISWSESVKTQKNQRPNKNLEAFKPIKEKKRKMAMTPWSGNGRKPLL